MGACLCGKPLLRNAPFPGQGWGPLSLVEHRVCTDICPRLHVHAAGSVSPARCDFRVITSSVANSAQTANLYTAILNECSQ